MSYIDTRDLFEELTDLRNRREAANTDDAEDFEQLDEDETERLKALEELADEIGEDTMRDGETMIPVYDFTAYAEELADDLGMINRDLSWPFNHIDWEAAANELKQDYAEVEFDGESYYVRMS